MIVLGLVSAASAAPSMDVFYRCWNVPAGESRACDCLRAPPEHDLWLGKLTLGDKVYGTCFDTDWVMEGSPGEQQDMRGLLEQRADQVARRYSYLVLEDQLVSQKDPDEISGWVDVAPVVDTTTYELRDAYQVLVAVVDAGPWELVQAMELDVDKDEVMDVVVTTGDGQLWVAYGPIKELGELLTAPEGIDEPKL